MCRRSSGAGGPLCVGGTASVAQTAKGWLPIVDGSARACASELGADGPTGTFFDEDGPVAW